ncbi:OmpA family protein [Moraxella atlantae]|uniref:Outer membrane protein OmpAb n=1 Tax=Faucicola atlantae TaxID=34059 RepID=A0A378Q5R5_9GAMM|nr:OmpA family protein [Moraxella atlantae]OPH36645.1 hypothetical protein B5J92_02810 [Moraxella atlantae]STY96141.1 Outer membrane protein OmpAb [Moraxella atlantae]
MKLNKIALAVIAAATLPAVANAGVTVTPVILGYHWSESIEDTADKQRDLFRTGKNLYRNKDGNPIGGRNGAPNGGVALEDGLYTGAAIGIELTPTIALEVEYGETSVNAEASEKSAKAGVNRFDAKQKMTSGNFLIGTETFSGYTNSNFKPYILIGAGQSNISIKNREAYVVTAPDGIKQKGVPGGGQYLIKSGSEVAQSTDTIGNLGIGANWRINDAMSLRGEARAIHNFDNNWWEGMALAGLNVVLGGHLAPATEIVEPQIVPVQPTEVVAVQTDGDDDQDGVPNSIDLCPNTPLNTVVDANGCPVKVDVKEELQMELRVFFDNDKSNIKEQYRPEIQRVAEKMNEYPNATASIEGHASRIGKRSSATYNQRLSEARANAVKGMLVNQFGIAPNRISTVGYGFSRPIADNSTPEGRAMNRRVYAKISGDKTNTVNQTQGMNVQP